MRELPANGVVVFLGPSLPADVARAELPEAVFLPPVRRGDLYSVVVDRRPSVVGIVDGLFDSIPAVVHKEILFALSNGVRVLGAASMGALRAAECWPFGMEGVGTIFDRYKSGAWDADDEVAVVHGPEETGFRPGSIALATIRLALEAAVAQRVVSAETARNLISHARAQFYPDRVWESLFTVVEAGPAQELASLRAFVAAEQPDAKRDDALALLRRVRTLLQKGLEYERPDVDFDFEATSYWDQLVSETRAIARDKSQGTVSITHDDLIRHVRLQPDGADRMRGAALLHLLVLEAHRRESPAPPESVQAASDRFRRRLGLITAQQTQQWLRDQQMTWGELVELMTLEVTLKGILTEASAPIRRLLPVELRRRAEFDATARAIGEKKRTLHAAGVASLTLDDVDITFDGLMSWYQEHYRHVSDTLDHHAQELGFDSTRQFLSELLLEYSIAGRTGPS